MRKIEKEVIGAFIKGDTKAMANTESAINPIPIRHSGNTIAVQ